MARRTGYRKATRTPEQRDAERQALLDQMTAQVAALRGSDEWQAWLRFAARFHTYSFRNQMLILAQRPNATLVMGYGDRCPKGGDHGWPCTKPSAHRGGWLSLGRHVVKGEHGISIMAPSTRKVEVEDKRTGEVTEKRWTAFRPVHVFDVSQTDGAPLPDRIAEPPRTTGTVDDLVTACTLAGELGFTVKEHATAIRNGARGWWEPGTTVVHVVRDAAHPGDMARTIFHELAHALDVHLPQRSKRDRELVAESVSFIVSEAHGLAGALDPDTCLYLASWKADTDTMLAVGHDVRTLAAVLLGEAVA
jgi:hypothetical protein